ncbi:MAG: AIR synthase related protein [Candidatus Methanospirareceae archaeon]
MDLEGFAKRWLREGKDENKLIFAMSKHIMEIKGVSEERAEEISRAIVEEAKRTIDIKDKEGVLVGIKSGVSMGDFGVGSRGYGDFYTHEKIAEIIGKTKAIVDSSALSDAGVVEFKRGRFIAVTVDGMHSRLSDFPFIAGFHVARAALRDIYVMGAKPVALFSDIHVADDGDVAKVFEHIAGISTVSEATGVPLITGSTLRIGGDVVIGERMTGCVGAVGIAEEIITREGAREGDVILMTEGAGGGTITTAALYHGDYDVVYETLNINFLKACDAIVNSNILKRGKIHVMTDVTNGGIRGDANEIAKVASVKLVFHEDKIRDLVNKRVLEMLNRHKIDYLGVSLDALLLICEEDIAREVKEIVRGVGVRMEEVGYVERGRGAEIVINGEKRELKPKFREAAYTPIKKVVGESAEKDFEWMKKRVDKAVEEAKRKKEKVKKMLGV